MKYTEPEMNISMFEAEDIVTISNHAAANNWIETQQSDPELIVGDGFVVDFTTKD